MRERPTILVTNDDSIHAPGIRYLIKLMQELGEVIVVAPDQAQSGMSHAITIRVPLTLRKVLESDGLTEYVCNGTPVDCVKLAEHHLLKDRKFDLIVSGINHGSNSSVNTIYSGTMAAVVEGMMGGVPSVGFSLLDYKLEADFSHAREQILSICRYVLEKGVTKGVGLNVNIPKNNGNPLKGIKVCRQAMARWEEEFDERHDPHNRQYFWLTGSFHNDDKGEDTDEHALANYYVSVVPVQYDWTAHNEINKLSKLEE